MPTAFSSATAWRRSARLIETLENVRPSLSSVSVAPRLITAPSSSAAERRAAAPSWRRARRPAPPDERARHDVDHLGEMLGIVNRERIGHELRAREVRRDRQGQMLPLDAVGQLLGLRLPAHGPILENDHLGAQPGEP